MKRVLGLLVSLIILAIIWWQVDLDSIGEAVAQADPRWLAAGLAAVIPLTLGTALRFRMLSRTHLPLGTATRLILSASTLNLILPSKMGDLAKSVVLTSRYGYDGKLALALVVMEKMLDMASLLFWGVLAMLWLARDQPLFWLGALATGGLLLLLVILLSPLGLSAWLIGLAGRLLPGKAGKWVGGFGAEWQEAVRWFWSARGRMLAVVLVSLTIWAGHLAQFWLFAQALAFVPFLDNMAFATLAILAGLLPLTMAGVGTRDAAIVLLYAPYLTAGQGAVLGVLATLRYLMPAIAGLPFMGDYLDRAAKERRA